jgi:hypothetical protein
MKQTWLQLYLEGSGLIFVNNNYKIFTLQHTSEETSNDETFKINMNFTNHS